MTDPTADPTRRELQPTSASPPTAELSSANAEPSEAPQWRYGRFTLRRLHAKGGLGEVHVAEDEELGREVALKRMQDRHQHNPESRRRFLQEAAITARLEHPGIVPIYGLTHDEHGQPCYAMRFIEGESLKEAIDRFYGCVAPDEPTGLSRRADGGDEPRRSLDYTSLPFRQLLQRFISVCNTIAYAHSRGIIHRDIKPQNVMIGKYGETLVVDWGLAKEVRELESESVGAQKSEAGAPTLSLSNSLTQEGQAVGTPAYMAPEQAAGQWEAVGPGSDIFSLGATLYTALTGQAPIQGQDALEAIERARSGDWRPPRQVKSSVPKPLDAICRKAMAAAPAERYATANELAEDVERWLADEPVGVFEEPMLMRAARWARKHKAIMATAAAILLTAIVALSAGLYFVNAERARADQGWRAEEIQRAEAQTQAELARNHAKTATENQAISDAALGFVESKIFAAARPKGQAGGLGYDVKLADALTTALPWVGKSFADRPLIEARLRTTLGSSFGYLGHAKTAAEQFERARSIFARERGPGHRDTLTTMMGQAICLSDLGQHDSALKLKEETLSLMKAKLGPDDSDTLICMNTLANSYARLGRHAEALPLREKTLELRRAKFGAEHTETLASMVNLALSYAAVGRVRDAVKLYEEALPVMNAKIPDHPYTLNCMNNLANSYERLGRQADALRLREQHLERAKASLGPDHPGTLQSMYNLGHSYDSVGRTGDALRYFQEAFTQQKVKLGPDHPDTLTSMAGVAYAYEGLGRYAEALAVIDECLEHCRGKAGISQLVADVIELRLRHFVKRKDAAGCRATTAMWEEFKRTDAASLYTAACLRAVTAAVVKADASTPTAEAARLAQVEADRAMAWLEQAVAAGYKDAAQIKDDKDLDALREREDFKKLLNGLLLKR